MYFYDYLYYMCYDYYDDDYYYFCCTNAEKPHIGGML